MKYLTIATIVIALLVITAWVINFYKLTQCDFQAPYKGEVIHAVGLVPAFAPITVWFNDK